MLQSIRAFFDARDVLEVETPQLSAGANTDPSLASFAVDAGEAKRYLHTSPEFAMKRLLAAGVGDCYQVCKVFRAGESGRWHNPEFTLLEWYRLGFDDVRLSDEVVALIRALGAADAVSLPVVRLSYRQLFQEILGVDPLTAKPGHLAVIARQQGVHPGCEMNGDAWLDLLISHCIAPAFPDDRLTIVSDFPASQAALARLHPDGVTAARFEIYWGSVELANGYHELSDADEQRRRVMAEQQQRVQMGLVQLPADERFLQAMDAGIPDCAGVALGLDRLLMKLMGAQHVDAVIAFPFERA